MIKLRPVAITDLNFKYARDMGDYKIRHYTVPYSVALMKKFVGQEPEDIVREFIQKTENETEIEFIYNDDYSAAHFGMDAIPESMADTMVPPFTPIDISNVALKNDRRLRKALLRRRSMNMLYQWNYYPTIFHRYRDVLVDKYNKYVVPKVNKFLYWWQGVDPSTYMYGVKQLSYSQLKYQRRVEPVRFFAVAFEKCDTDAAIESLLQDLRVLHKKGVLMGHLCMPSMIQLANTSGADTSYFAVFCFVIIDSNKMNTLSGYKSPLDVPIGTLNQLGTKNEVFEGSTNWLNGVKPDDKYKIESVTVRDLVMENAQEQVIQSYQNSREWVNKVAADSKSRLGNLEKISSKSEPAWDSSGSVRSKNILKIDAEFINKETGEVTSLSEEYKKNSQDS